MYQNSSLFSEADSDITGNLIIANYSTYEAVEQGSAVTPGTTINRYQAQLPAAMPNHRICR